MSDHQFPCSYVYSLLTSSLSCVLVVVIQSSVGKQTGGQKLSCMCVCVCVCVCLHTCSHACLWGGGGGVGVTRWYTDSVQWLWFVMFSSCNNTEKMQMASY